MSYKYIIFDFIGVLIKKSENYAPNQVVDEVDSVIGRVVDDDEFRRNITENYRLTESEFEEVLEKIVAKYELYDNLWKILPTLKRRFKLVVINNGTALTIAKFKEKFPIDKYFVYFISSALEGTKKPDKDIYLLALRKLGANPSECIFMDDTFENVTAAKEMGMTGIYWKTFDEGFEEFKELLRKI